jgi:hypothetical protein
MDTWKEKNPTFEYIRWTEREFVDRKIRFRCGNRINEIEEICGKADIIRWEILYEYGGVFLDADSICVEPIDDVLMRCKSFAGWENEQVRPGLVAVGTMGFPPKHPLVKAVIDWIESNPVSFAQTNQRAWQNTGPMLLTRMLRTGKFTDMTIFPSYTFLPIHCTGVEYSGHGRIYAYQEWGSTKQSYDTMNDMSLPSQFLPPTESVSILVSSLNTKAAYLKQCLESIKHQTGRFHIELVWVNDGSDAMHTQILDRSLDNFEKTTRHTSVVRVTNETNKGLGYSLHHGLLRCSNEIVLRMDSDDMMLEERIVKQVGFMNRTTDCILSGGQIQMFREQGGKLVGTGTTSHPTLTREAFAARNHANHWLMNHPTFCFRKSKIIEVGNYNAEIHSMCEDFELILRVLAKHGTVHNIPDIVLNYRLHPGQLTYGGGKEGGAFWTAKRNELVERLLK